MLEVSKTFEVEEWVVSAEEVNAILHTIGLMVLLSSR